MKEEIRSKGLSSSVLIFSYDLVPAEWTPLCKIDELKDSIDKDQLMLENLLLLGGYDTKKDLSQRQS